MSAEDGFRPPRVGVVGGRGRMGSWFASRLAASGCPVVIADIADGPLRGETLAACPVIILAVPVAAMDSALKAIAPHAPAGGLIADLASLKAAPLAQMLALAPGQVLGLHPLFGPGAESLAGQTVFACPGRPGPLVDWLLAWLASQGARLTFIKPQRHDELMALVQSLRQMLLFGLGAALREQGFDPADLPLAGAWFNQIWDLLVHQCRQPAGLYAGLALANPEAGPALESLAGALESLAGRLRAGDVAGLEAQLSGIIAWVEEAEKKVDAPLDGVYCIQKSQGRMQ